MIVVDTALAEREAAGRPIRVGVMGAGYMARPIAWQLLSTPGLQLAAICARRPAEAERALRDGGVDDPATASTARELEAAVDRARPVVTDDPELLAASGSVDAIVEATSSMEDGARFVVAAIEGGKHVLLVNAELDSTVGPALKARADRAGVIYTAVGGEEHGVAMNLYRYVRTIGLTPVLVGNIKGFLDRYRTPETQRAFAESVGQRPKMITSFADGTKLSMEATIIANATGHHVAQRGMVGLACEHVREVLGLFPAERLLAEPLVDFTVGAEPGSGAFIVGHGDDPAKAQYMRYFKMGDGPLYLFYQQHHLPHLEATLSLARAVLFGDATVAPRGPAVCEVVSVAKRDLTAGEELDGIGGFCCYGQIDNASTVRQEGLLPIGLSEGSRLLVDVAGDRAVRLVDVERPSGRMLDALWNEQTEAAAPSAQ